MHVIVNIQVINQSYLPALRAWATVDPDSWRCAFDRLLAWGLSIHHDSACTKLGKRLKIPRDVTASSETVFGHNNRVNHRSGRITRSNILYSIGSTRLHKR